MSKENHPNYGLKLKDHHINRAGLIGCAAILTIANLGVEVVRNDRKEPKNELQIEAIDEEVTLLEQLERLLYEPTASVIELQENILLTLEEYQTTYEKISGYEDTVISTLLKVI